MTILPHINRMKFGILDQDYMNSLAASTSQFDDIKGGLKKLLHEDTRRGTNSFLAQITEALTHASYGTRVISWYYRWKRVDFKDLFIYKESGTLATEINYINTTTGVNDQTTDGYQNVLGGDATAGLQGWAYNLAEISNIMTYPIVFGIDVDGSSYPDGFSPQPVPDSSFVYLTQNSGSQFGFPSFIFDRQGTHDGVCEE